MNTKQKDNNFKAISSIFVTKAFIVIMAIIAVIMCIWGTPIVRIVMTKTTPLVDDRYRFWILLIGGYICAGLLFLFLYLLYKLIVRIEKGEVFTTENVKALKRLSDLVLSAGVITFFIGITCTYMIFIITAATAFVTPIIRVIGHAFAKAVEMKDELDFTV
ncbi:DUF2975 domain-containing protein [Butyrivibrio sp. YAB3001]|uniref:DUF2975 domain-containing protein n=1 Tax=Butyrivibrio sp. YAB3001 TaxID=1520812 RepID=UPI0008F620F4|nr:DUF2975 domain-containing protein [Butyrivibrio sp. YAB3001]SFB83235.1 Protein of unknown function [Butyrivibrio sp. YAB3001]